MVRRHAWATVGVVLAVALAEISSTAAGDDEIRPIGVSLTAVDGVEPGQKVTGRLALANEQDTAASCRISYTVQTDGAMYHAGVPDPVYGVDCALGARSWTVADGKVVEEGSLTDGKDYTDAGTAYVTDHFTEAFQYVDLGEGKVRRITGISYLSGDANHAWKVDVAVSRDGQSYVDVPGLQGVDMFKKWGEIVLPLSQVVEGRLIRLRYHRDGQRVSVLRMPCRLSVFDGVVGDSFELPEVGEVVAAGVKDIKVGAKASVTVELAADRVLTPGMYLLAARVECGAMRELVYRHGLVMPEALRTVSAESRFGLNAAKGEWAPMVRRLGVGWVRFENMKWPFVSPEPGVYRR
ncbi:MAG: hypothetical protein KA354_15970 [Phycisphaerae bacterium]|nr:hypothetical protein [Phycisphaerae bacterium]